MAGCEKVLEVSRPVVELSAETVFNSDKAAEQFVLNMYTRLNTALPANYLVPMDLYGDDLNTSLSTAALLEFRNTTVSPGNSYIQNYWREMYSIIYNANDWLNKTKENNSLSPAIKMQLDGEVYFLRAFAYFNLMQQYGGVPLVLSTDVKETALVGRATEEKVLEQILNDLESSVNVLTAAYPGGEKFRANLYTALALRARVAYFTKNWDLALSSSDIVIESEQYQLVPVEEVFTGQSPETIFQIWNVDGFTGIGSRYVPSGSSRPSYFLNTGLIESFDAGDARMSNWIRLQTTGADTRYSPFKYRNRTLPATGRMEYLVAFRLAELIMIRAEASFQKAEYSKALEDLNLVRKRAGVEEYPEELSAALLEQALEAERRRELFCEWGDRFYYLRMKGKADAILSAMKPNWKTTGQLLPIPLYDLQNNPLLTQNPGY